MSSLEKLVKALEALKLFPAPPSAAPATLLSSHDDAANTQCKKKERMAHCLTIADGMCSVQVRSSPDFPRLLGVAVETFLHLRDDPDADLRILADESLNRTIRAMSEGNIGRVQVELYKEMKRNGPTRVLREALWRFGDLCHTIRPHKCRAYVINLWPCVARVATRRGEETLQETLASALKKIFPVLGPFTNHSEVKLMMGVFLESLSSASAVTRRSAASALVSLAANCRKPHVFIPALLGYVLDRMVPVQECHPALALGGLVCLRLLSPHLQPMTLDADRTMQMFETCVHFLTHADHNVAAAALDTLQVVLKCPPPSLASAILDPGRVARSRVHASNVEPGKLEARSLSLASVSQGSVCQEECEGDLLLAEGMESMEGINLAGKTTMDGDNGNGEETEKEEEDGATQGEARLQEWESSRQQRLTADSSMIITDPLQSMEDLESETPPASPRFPTDNNVDIGSLYGDPESSALEFCVRAICATFLLTGCPGQLCSEQVSRVSLKGVALGCLGAALRLHPGLIDLPLQRNETSGEKVQFVRDVLRFVGHHDPTLRGLTCALISSYLASALVQSGGGHLDQGPPMGHLVGLLSGGLEDGSARACYLAIGGLKTCLPAILESEQCHLATPLLNALLPLANCYYCLIKMELAELLSVLPYVSISRLPGMSGFQEKAWKEVFLVLVQDEDPRIRQATANALVSLAPNLFYPADIPSGDPILCRAAKSTQDTLRIPNLGPSVPELGLGTDEANSRPGAAHGPLDGALSRITRDLAQSMLMAKDRFALFGCAQALATLGVSFPPVSWPIAWGCRNPGALSLAVDLATASQLAVDLATQQHLLNLCGDLFLGVATSCLTGGEVSSMGSTWAMLPDRSIAKLADQLMTHVTRVLSIFVHVLDETPVGNAAPAPKIAPIAATVSSPIRRRSRTDSGASSGSKSKPADAAKLGHFASSPHYCRLHAIVQRAYANYKVSLDTGSSERLVALLRAALGALAQVLEIASVHELAKHLEDLLSTLGTVFVLEAPATLRCVRKLLRALFGTNMAARWDPHTANGKGPEDRDGNSIYRCCFESPHLTLGASLASVGSQDGCPGGAPKWPPRSPFHSLSRAMDKASLTSYIRMFEPVVIKALKHYTVSSDVTCQVEVLNLLTELVRLRVNYCLLDSEQIFIGFVIKQLEYVEEGQVARSALLVPRVFRFLVLLSYERYHSRPVITVPKIIQLCDGLMASGQDPATHVVPALRPVVVDLFVVRAGSAGDRELDTQREVLVSMLLRLVHHPEVLEPLEIVLQSSRRDSTGEERWRKWSRQAADAILPLLARRQVKLVTCAQVDSLHRLLATMAPQVFRPVDPLLKALLAPPPLRNATETETERWASFVSSILVVLLSQSPREDVILSRLETLLEGVEGWEGCPHPHPQPPQLPEIEIVQIMFRAMQVLSARLSAAVFTPSLDVDTALLHRQLGMVMLLCAHVFQCGSYPRMAKAGCELVSAGVFHETLEEMHTCFLGLGKWCPALSLQWCCVMTLLGYGHVGFWTRVFSPPPNCSCLNLQVLRTGGVVLYSDYMCENLHDSEQVAWLLMNHVRDVVSLALEPPVAELIAALHRNPSASGLLVQAIGARCCPPDETDHDSSPVMMKRVLRCLEGGHVLQSGAILNLVVSRFLCGRWLALSRAAANMAARRAEILMAEEDSAVLQEQLATQDLQSLLHRMSEGGLSQRHSRLASLLDKLASERFDLSPVGTPDRGRPFKPGPALAAVQVDREWYLTLVKRRCTRLPGRRCCASECLQLMSRLDLQEALDIMEDTSFDTSLLRHMVGEHTDCPELRTAASAALLKAVSHLAHSCPGGGNKVTCAPPDWDCESSGRMLKFFQDGAIFEGLSSILPALAVFVGSGGDVPYEVVPAVTRLGVLCLEACSWTLQNNNNNAVSVDQLHLLLSGADAILRLEAFQTTLGNPERHVWVASCAAAILQVARYLLPHARMPQIQCNVLGSLLENRETRPLAQACLSMASIVSWMEVGGRECWSQVPRCMWLPVSRLVVSISRTPLLNSFVCTPPAVWGVGWSPKCVHGTKVGPVPLEHLQEVEVLQQFVYRLGLLGWTSRQQFEETWMALLGVLNASRATEGPPEEMSPDEEALCVQSSCLSVRALTTLLLQTLLFPTPGDPNSSHFSHASRDTPPPFGDTDRGKRMEKANQTLRRMLPDIQAMFFDANLERTGRPGQYGMGQLSLERLRQPGGNSPDQPGGLDTNSCLHFLLDLYTQWLLQPFPPSGQSKPGSNTPLPLILEAARSALSLSDLFTDRAQFRWLAETFMSVSRNHPAEDDLLAVYVVGGIGKAAAVLGADMDSLVGEGWKRVLESSLRSPHLPTRISGVHSLLLLLQCGRANAPTKTDLATEQAIGAGFAHQMLPLAIDCIQRQLGQGVNLSGQSEWHLLSLWSLLFYILEHFEEEMADTEFAPPILQTVLHITSHSSPPSQHPSSAIYISLLKGLERLVTSRSVTGKMADQVTKLALERLRCPAPAIALPALRLLLACMYAGGYTNPPNTAKTGASSVIAAATSGTSGIAGVFSSSTGASRLSSALAGGLSMLPGNISAGSSLFSGSSGIISSPAPSSASAGNAGSSSSSFPAGNNSMPGGDPEELIQSMERVSVLFERLKRGYPFEVQASSAILQVLLPDFFPPSEILNKVIGEFIAPQQPHPHFMAAVVFQVFEEACGQCEQPLLQDWVVLSLGNLTQRCPVALSVWSLSCFFIAASQNIWLRAAFPHLQCRAGRIDHADRRLFCLAALDFYRHLGVQSQKDTFVRTFQEASEHQPNSPFADLHICLQAL